METETITVKMSETHTDWEISREALGEITPENICECSKEKLDELQAELQEQCNKAVKDLVKEYFKNETLR